MVKHCGSIALGGGHGEAVEQRAFGERRQRGRRGEGNPFYSWAHSSIAPPHRDTLERACPRRGKPGRVSMSGELRWPVLFICQLTQDRYDLPRFTLRFLPISYCNIKIFPTRSLREMIVL
uniref:Uncharacterized protein n=1 Tax=Arundo donax TaxID=35708 RepID=A0A0A9G886_ARUDO